MIQNSAQAPVKNARIQILKTVFQSLPARALGELGVVLGVTLVNARFAIHRSHGIARIEQSALVLAQNGARALAAHIFVLTAALSAMKAKFITALTNQPAFLRRGNGVASIVQLTALSVQMRILGLVFHRVTVLLLAQSGAVTL
ncbi:MAG: hypothetical protein AABW85_03970 [archaeon]